MIDNSEKITQMLIEANELQENGNYEEALELCFQALELQQEEHFEIQTAAYLVDIIRRQIYI